jgi:5-methylcytosine-specific restriction protein A
MPTLKRISLPAKQQVSEQPNQGRKTNHHEVYHTTRWRKLREQLLQAEPLCRTCKNGTPQRLTAATVADHIVAINNGGDPWDIDNLQPQCEKCHNAKSGRERWRKAKKLVGI